MIHFHKYQGAGNDFIIVDNRQKAYQLTETQIKQMCDRHFGIGADGLMELQETPGYDFLMVYYNADGKPGSMCGNGGRCLVKFAHHAGIHKSEYLFLASDGPHTASLEMNGWIRLKMKDVHAVERNGSYDLLNTGSPHYIKAVSTLESYPVIEEGREIRYSDRFKQEGVNVNFVEVLNDTSIYVRTYERGVESETLSCGTGVTASALVNAHNEIGFNHVDIRTPGGKLYVEFNRKGENSFDDIWLAGPAEKVFEGQYEG